MHCGGKMRTIIAGSRCFTYLQDIQDICNMLRYKISVVLSGHARGVDRLGERWADINHIPVEIYRAKWDELGRSAGIKRNIEMANNADMLIAIWDGSSNGTRHIIEYAQDIQLPCYIKIIPQ